ncbi:MAG: glycerol-3-phosphate 1-O-acyltransferase PlsY [bacterium]|nr:glycerol-3-phosphate 1-O-acyltransferase PlsY [bacterium]
MEINTTMGLFLLGAYLLGSIPSAVWIGKIFFQIDVREHGSGNAGATNTLRVLGKKAGITVLFLDFLKGLAASSLFYLQDKILPGSQEFRQYQLLLGIVAVLGHVYPIFAGFRGGKGIATLLGMVVSISWPVALLCALVFVISVWLTKFVSLGSMLGAIMSGVFVRFIYGSEETFFMYFCIGIGLMVIYTHRANIGRLRNGTESKISFSKKPEIEK